jgi:hypothetical protein
MLVLNVRRPEHHCTGAVVPTPQGQSRIEGKTPDDQAFLLDRDGISQSSDRIDCPNHGF